jgi:hypothetical protein
MLGGLHHRCRLLDHFTVTRPLSSELPLVDVSEAQPLIARASITASRDRGQRF